MVLWIVDKNIWLSSSTLIPDRRLLQLIPFIASSNALRSPLVILNGCDCLVAEISNRFLESFLVNSQIMVRHSSYHVVGFGYSFWLVTKHQVNLGL